MKYEKAAHDRITIERFKDGDTLTGFISCNHCGAVTRDTIRLVDIDSWEPKGNTRIKAMVVSDFLTQRYKGERGIISAVNIRRDKYGRRIGDIIINGESLAGTIVGLGLGWFGVGEPPPHGLTLPQHLQGNRSVIAA